ncbi:hypothetical protein SUGI_0252340 [Cryptomeria japonica]|nr:hypothetical protein SUGI_0252340 [Cryptomeria japonica]
MGIFDFEGSRRAEDKIITWAIVTYSGTLEKVILEEAMKAYGENKAKSKPHKKKKANKKKVALPSMGTEKIFEFKRPRGRPKGPEIPEAIPFADQVPSKLIWMDGQLGWTAAPSKVITKGQLSFNNNFLQELLKDIQLQCY